MTRYLVTGGCGFVGSRLCMGLRSADPSAHVVAFDNLRRRGSELNVLDLAGAGVEVVHGDIRIAADLDDLDGMFDVVLDAAAEPSVHSGTTGSPRYVIDTNLGGTVNLLEFARRRAKTFVLISTSRTYAIDALRDIRAVEGESRFEIASNQELPGVGPEGISEAFPTDGAGSFYGASKLASEMLAQEYAAATDLQVLINRCGVLAGAGQFGKVDQGVIALWVASHIYGRPLDLDTLAAACAVTIWACRSVGIDRRWTYFAAPMLVFSLWLPSGMATASYLSKFQPGETCEPAESSGAIVLAVRAVLQEAPLPGSKPDPAAPQIWGDPTPPEDIRHMCIVDTNAVANSVFESLHTASTLSGVFEPTRLEDLPLQRVIDAASAGQVVVIGSTSSSLQTTLNRLRQRAPTLGDLSFRVVPVRAGSAGVFVAVQK